MSTQRAMRLAHRGDWRAGAENTLPAFQAALALPACDGLEFDVRLAADGVPVICHDDTLQRVHGRPEAVAALQSGELSDIGVPSLADVLAAVGRHPFLDVEIKVDGGLAVVEVLAAGRGPELHRAVVSSFDPRALVSIAHRAPGWPRWLNTVTLDRAVLRVALELGCRGVAVDWRALGPASVGLARRAGLEVAAWTVRRRSMFDRLAGLGVIAVCVEGAALDG